MKVLIIDDERSIRNTLKEILEFEGHQITLAENGASGLEAAAAANFDVIFCDIKMPGMDGVEVLDKLAESGNETPVVMISGHGSIDTAVECIKQQDTHHSEKCYGQGLPRPRDQDSQEEGRRGAGDYRRVTGHRPHQEYDRPRGPDRCQGAHYRLQRYR